MHLENVVFDATDPQSLGRFWEALLGTEKLTDEPAGYETRVSVPDGPVLDLCFQRVPEPPIGPARLRLEVAGEEEQDALVERLVGLGGEVEQDAAGIEVVDLAGNRFGVRPWRAAYAEHGPIAALALQVAHPARERDFWSWLTGWSAVDDGGWGLRHPSGRGPVLELWPEPAPKGAGKNRIHLDIRLDPGDDPDALAAEISDRGGRELHPDWGSLPWRLFQDPSGNDFCLLPSPS